MMRYPHKYRWYARYNRNNWGRAGKYRNRGIRWKARNVETRRLNSLYKYRNQERRMYKPTTNFGVIPYKPKSFLERHGGYRRYFDLVRKLQRYEYDLYYAEDLANLARQRWPQDYH